MRDIRLKHDSDNFIPRFSLYGLSPEDQELVKNTFEDHIEKAFQELEEKGLHYGMGFFDRK